MTPLPPDLPRRAPVLWPSAWRPLLPLSGPPPCDRCWLDHGLIGAPGGVLALVAPPPEPGLDWPDRCPHAGDTR